MVCLSIPTAPRHDAAGVVFGGRFLWDFARPVGGRWADGNGGLYCPYFKTRANRAIIFYQVKTITYGKT
jgi:hypothetical protein